MLLRAGAVRSSSSGRHVIDAKNHISAVRDVAIRDGKIAAVEARSIRRRRSRWSIYAGCMCRPGWWIFTSTFTRRRVSGIRTPATTTRGPDPRGCRSRGNLLKLWRDCLDSAVVLRNSAVVFASETAPVKLCLSETPCRAKFRSTQESEDAKLPRVSSSEGIRDSPRGQWRLVTSRARKRS